MTGGYDPTSTPPDAPLDPGADAPARKARPRPAAVAAQRRLVAGLRLHRRAAAVCPRATSASATAAARTRRTSTTSSSPRNPKVAGFDGAVNSYVTYLETLAG